MKKINLIPREAVIGRRVFPPRLLPSPFAQIIALAAAALLLAGGFAATSVGRHERRLAGKETELAQAQAELREKEREKELIRGEREVFLSRRKTVEEKISFLESVKEEKINFSKVLLRLTNLVPPEVWIDNLAVEKDLIVITGAAGGNDDIGRFMNNLEDSSYFKETGFTYARRRESRGRKVFEYELVTYLVSGRE